MKLFAARRVRKPSKFRNIVMKSSQVKKEKRVRRQARIRSKIFGTAERPRLSVFKSNRYIYAQIIDDNAGKTLVSVSSILDKKGTMLERSVKVGESVGKSALEKKIKKVVFDRGGFLYAGNIKVLADSARKAGLLF